MKRILLLSLAFTLILTTMVRGEVNYDPSFLVGLGIEEVPDVCPEYMPEVKVAIIDSGVCTDAFTAYFSEDRIDEASINMLDGSEDIDDTDDGHGTAIASIIAGGTTDNVKLMIIKATDDYKYNHGVIEKSIEYALDNGADIINVSASGIRDKEQSQYTQQVFERADKMGVPIVCAMGNRATNNSVDPDVCLFPAALDYGNIIGVSSLDEIGVLSSYSSYGYGTDFSAVGTDVSTIVFTDYRDEASTTRCIGIGKLSGTSIATPVITCAYCYAMTVYLELGGKRDYEKRDLMITTALRLSCNTDMSNIEKYGSGTPNISKFIDILERMNNVKKRAKGRK